MVNVENINKVADAIENHSVQWLGFNMGSYAGITDSSRPDKLDGCGTVACIAGWTKAVLGGVDNAADLLQWNLSMSRCGAVAEDVGKLLGLTIDEASELFHPYGWWRGNNQTPVQAVAVLRHLAETGRVDWSIAKPQEPA